MMQMKSKKCGLQNCLQTGVLRCATCHYISYCSRECQKQDWKLRHKRECSNLCGIIQSNCGDECSCVRGILTFYHRKNEYSDRWVEVAAYLTSLLDESAVSAGSSESVDLRFLYLRCVAYRDVLDNLPMLQHLISLEAMESYELRATVAFDSAETAFRSLGAAHMPIIPDWPSIIHSGRAHVLFLQAECLKNRGQLVEAVGKCKAAIASVELLSDKSNHRVEFIYQCALFLRDNKQYQEARDVLKKLYCDFCEVHGPGDVYLQSIVADLATVTGKLGDLEEAEYYSRSALDTLRAHRDATTDPTGQRLCQGLLALADVLADKVRAQSVEVEAAPGRSVSSETSFDTAMCLEAEALYEEVLPMINSSSNSDEFDSLIPLLSLNDLYCLRDSTDDAAEKSFKKEIDIIKTKKWPLDAKASRMSRLAKFYTMKLCFEAFLDYDRPQLGGYKDKVIIAKRAALEGIAATAGMTTDDDHEYSLDVIGGLLKYLSLIANRFVNAGMLAVIMVRREVGNSDESMDYDLLNGWVAVPDGLVESCMEWIAPVNTNNSNSSSTNEGNSNGIINNSTGGSNGTKSGGIGTIVGTTSGGSGVTGTAIATSMIASRCRHLLEASLLLSVGEAVARVYSYGKSVMNDEDAALEIQSEEGGDVKEMESEAEAGDAEIRTAGLFRSRLLGGAGIGGNNDGDSEGTSDDGDEDTPANGHDLLAEKAQFLFQQAMETLEKAESFRSSSGCGSIGCLKQGEEGGKSFHVRAFDWRRGKATSEYLSSGC